MTDFDFDSLGFDDVAPAVKLREAKVQPVPTPILALAQRSRDGVQDPNHPDKLLHVLQKPMPLAMAKAFQKHMKNAGKLTTPPSSMSVVIDAPADATAETVVLVKWRAGNLRGPGAAAAAAEPALPPVPQVPVDRHAGAR